MSQVIGNHDGVRDLQSMSRQNNVRIQGWPCREAPETPIGPKMGSSPHDGSRQWEIGKEAAKLVEMMDAPGRGSPTSKSEMEKASPRFVISDLR